VRRALSETLLVAVVARERYGRGLLDVIFAFAAAIFILACIHYGAMRAR
jgi:hypothetical protein